MIDTPATRVRVARGGVSPTPNKPAIIGGETARVFPGHAPAAGAFPNFTYHGGPVISLPLVYTSFWGNQWLQDPGHLERAGQLSEFMKDLVASQFMNVLTQYGVASSGCYIQASFFTNMPSTISDTDIHTHIQAGINAGALPEPTPNTALIIYLDDNTAVNDAAMGIVMCEPTSDTAFGYHYFFSTSAGHPCYYAIIPSLTDTCLAESCPGGDSTCSLSVSELQVDRLTQVTSHEFAEMTTDPEVNAWYDDSAGENGDICNGESAVISVGPNAWTVQRIYSKDDDINSNGASYCIASAPSPEPRLSPGPTAHPAVVGHANRIPPVDRLLPLPAHVFDVKSGSVTVKDDEMRTFARRLFFPVRPEHVLSDLPGFLRQASDILKNE